MSPEKPTRVRVRTRKPIVLLVRRIVGGEPAWLEHSGHRSDAEAEWTWEHCIRGRGITAWSCWVPRGRASDMVNDATIVPK